MRIPEPVPEPVLNEDFYMVKRLGGDVALPTPRTRFEKLLYIYAGGTIERPIPKTVEERFLDYITGGESELPAPKTRLQSYMYNVANPSNKIPVVPPKTRFECYWYAMRKVNIVISVALPVEFTSVDGSLLGYTIWGNSVQDGTPSPENPVEALSVGNRTANLIPAVNLENGWVDGYLLNDNGYISIDTFNVFQERTSPFIKIDKSASYVFSATFIDETHIDPWYGWLLYDNEKRPIASRHSIHSQKGGVIDTTDNAEYIRISLRTFGEQLEHVQLQLGTQATSYEPFGYKIPVTVSGENGEETTTNIYLSEPLRKIGDYADYIDFEKQLIKNVCVVNFTGEEEWQVQGNDYFTYIPNTPSGMPPTLCSAFSLSTPGSTTVGKYRLGGIDSWNGNVLFNYDNGAGGVDNFKSYLAEQYANGTPVKFYYPSVTAITELIEPPEIPTFAGTNVIDVNTAVKPSKIEVVTRTE